MARLPSEACCHSRKVCRSTDPLLGCGVMLLSPLPHELKHCNVRASFQKETFKLYWQRVCVYRDESESRVT